MEHPTDSQRLRQYRYGSREIVARCREKRCGHRQYQSHYVVICMHRDEASGFLRRDSRQLMRCGTHVKLGWEAERDVVMVFTLIIREIKLQ